MTIEKQMGSVNMLHRDDKTNKMRTRTVIYYILQILVKICWNEIRILFGLPDKKLYLKNE